MGCRIPIRQMPSGILFFSKVSGIIGKSEFANPLKVSDLFGKSEFANPLKVSGIIGKERVCQPIFCLSLFITLLNQLCLTTCSLVIYLTTL